MAATLQDDGIAAGTAMGMLGRVDAYGSFLSIFASRRGWAWACSCSIAGDPGQTDLHDYDECPYCPAASYTTLTFMGSVSYYATRGLLAGRLFNVFYQSLPTYNENFGLGYTSATSTGSFDFAARFTA